MGEKKPEPLDFVKDFQEYLTQQTHHVNMISGSVSGDKEAEALQGGSLPHTLLTPLHTSCLSLPSAPRDHRSRREGYGLFLSL